MRLAPVNDLAELVPVVDVLKRHVLHGGAGHNEAVIELVAEGVESVVELNQVVGAHVGGLVAGDAHEVAAHLQRRLGDEAQNLGLSLHLGGHEVQDGHAQRADLLGLGDLLLQGKDALLVQDLLGGKSVGDVDGHGARYLSGAPGAADGTAQSSDAPVGPPPASSYSLLSIASRPGVLPDREREIGTVPFSHSRGEKPFSRAGAADLLDTCSYDYFICRARAKRADSGRG